jgi:hypothetical protein
MINITITGHPERGQATEFSIITCSRGSDPAVALWEREVSQSGGVGGFRQTIERKDVTTVEMVNELVDAENGVTDHMLRALGWTETDLDGMWDAHRERLRNAQAS